MTKEPTTSELYRTIQDHIKYESGYQERFEEKLDQVLLQVTKTNGRVDAIEGWKEKHAHPLLEDYKENRAQVKGATKLWTLVWSGLIVIVGLTGTLYVKTLKTDILAEVQKIKNNGQ